MAVSREAFLTWLAQVERKSYYDILRVPRYASGSAIKGAYYMFSLLYHPDRYVEDTEEMRRLATEIFKRGVEAYRVLSRPESRREYDLALNEGHLRPIERKPPPKPVVRTLEMIATSARGKAFAARAEWHISAGQLEEARLALVNACQHEPDNAELAERLRFIYEALSLA